MKILIIRRDNIGDLILTTPLIASLARHFGGPVDVLVNTYNQAVLENNPHIGTVHLYSKLHHRQNGQSALGVIVNRIKTSLQLRRARYDVAIIAKEHWDKRPLQWAKLSGAKRIIAIGDQAPSSITDLVPSLNGQRHIVELLSQLALPLGITLPPTELELYPREQEVSALRQRLAITEGLPVYGIQISARKPGQRWQAEKFIRFMHEIAAQHPCQFLLFWSPGASDNKSHPGDDEKAAEILKHCSDISVTAVHTSGLRELIAGMSLCQQILTSDGGALHVAAGVNVPTVAMFGNSDAWFWGPWGVPSETLEAPGQEVAQLTVEQVKERFMALRQRVLATEVSEVVPAA
ncbi:glycosyltransferase family 9 protein [Tatumella citrea]|uniref:Glycosyl transferase n=1 Tax=Tatumella citrea TaxID=53336 RepID=A0A1Y0L9S9_TATCI|nr:glycosyltransferase family 9 protein [Tatumella citrea]ARU94814.1 glycosyl transferase [Tatumella citrea]ARU98852.1 glycosyl transferase [Tatumella citrea]